jgi:hypothetical protein
MSRSPITTHVHKSVGVKGRSARSGYGRTKAINAKTNAAMRASSAPTPRHQPTAGQLVGAGIVKGN